jgi:PHD/YefM family antitoxin component YafN of YafNO toxin-antitoxin module
MRQRKNERDREYPISEISMISLHPEFITKNGKKEFAVISYEEFEALQQFIADMEDLMDLRAAKEEERNQPSMPLSEVKRRL